LLFNLIWTRKAELKYKKLKESAHKTFQNRQKKKITKSSKIEGLFKQVHKTLKLLTTNPRHPSLKTHKYSSLDHPYDLKKDVFEAYIQNKTPGAYRVFWCYGPHNKDITIIAITPHP